MATTLLQALQGQQYKAAEDPFGIAGTAIASGTPYLYNPYASTGSNAAMTIGGSLLAGLLGGIGKHNAARDNLALSQQAGQLFQLPANERADFVKQNPRLSPLLSALQTGEYERQIKEQEDLAKRQRDLEWKLKEEQAMQPLRLAAKTDETLADQLFQQGEIIDGEGRRISLADLGIKDPISMEIEKARSMIPIKTEEIAATEGAKRQAEVDAYGYNPKREQEVDNLRREFSRLPEVLNFANVEKSAGIMKKAIDDPNAVSDLELIRYAILLIEPGMAVREGEQAAVLRSQSIPDDLKGAALKAWDGNAQLGTKAREGLLRLAMRSYEGHKSQYDRTLQFYRDQAKQRGIDPNRISYIGESTPSEQVFGGASNVITAPDGQLIEIID